MIIDSHSHLIAPPGLNSTWTMMEAAGRFGGRVKGQYVEDEALAAADRQIALMDEVGTDIQITSPRPYTLKHSHHDLQVVQWWVQNNNDLLALQAGARSDRIKPVAALPQVAGEPVTVVFDEFDRCIDELGFVGVLVNPDPGEGNGRTPLMEDEYWYPLYERLIDKDVPALLHCGACYGRENYSEHFISEESLAVLSLIRSDVFERFPGLKVIIPHGGGSIPYQLGRWIAQEGWAANLDPDEATASVLAKVRQFYYDTCLYTSEALELLMKVIGPDRVLFGTERPGSGRAFEDLRPVIEKLESLDDAGRKAVFEDNARRVYARAFTKESA